MKRPNLFIERIQLREMPPLGEFDEAEAERLSADNRDILAKYPASAMREAVAAKLAAREAISGAIGESGSDKGSARSLRFPNLPKSTLFRIVPVAAAACLAIAGTFTYIAAPELFSGRLGASLPVSGDNFAVRIKGGAPVLHVYRKAADGAELLSSGEKALENDVLQIRYAAGNDTWGAILSVDGNGTVTQHFPDSGNAAGKLDAGGEIALAFSYRLDDAPKFERFIFVSGAKEFSVSDLKHDLSNLARIHRTGSFALDPLLPDGTRATDTLLRK